jgi:hypothetical protein
MDLPQLEQNWLLPPIDAPQLGQITVVSPPSALEVVTNCRKHILRLRTGQVIATEPLAAIVISGSQFHGPSAGILWSIEARGINVLHAYDATDVFKEIYNSNQASARDTFGAAIRFTVPTVINGKVYVAGKTELAAFGSL